MLALGFAVLLLVTGGFAGEFDSGNRDETDCDVKNAETCYLIIIDPALGTDGMDYEKANSSCVDLGYKVARIPNLAVQIEIMKVIRQKMAEIKLFYWFQVWIGTTINSAGVVTPPIADGQWSPPYPVTKDRNFQWTNIYLDVNYNPTITPQGLINTYSHFKTNGVVCQHVPRIAIECEDGFIYREKCYFANIYLTFDLKFQDKERNCNAKGGTLGSILNQEHETLTENYVRSKNLDIKHYITIWIATTYNHWTRSFYTPDGQSYPSTSLRWFPGYPNTDPSATAVIFEVHEDPSDDPSSGVFNWFAQPRSRAAGVFCEKPIFQL